MARPFATVVPVNRQGLRLASIDAVSCRYQNTLLVKKLAGTHRHHQGPPTELAWEYPFAYHHNRHTFESNDSLYTTLLSLGGGGRRYSEIAKTTNCCRNQHYHPKTKTTSTTIKATELAKNHEKTPTSQTNISLPPLSPPQSSVFFVVAAVELRGADDDSPLGEAVSHAAWAAGSVYAVRCALDVWLRAPLHWGGVGGRGRLVSSWWGSASARLRGALGTAPSATARPEPIPLPPSAILSTPMATPAPVPNGRQ